MIDLISGTAGALAATFISKEIVTKLLGPTADYFGAGLLDLAKKRHEIAEKILLNAASKVPDLDREGTVPPRVLRDVVEQGSFSEEQISVEYFGGVLASSRSGVSRDDRAATFSAALARLSAYQIRCHYVLYTCIRQVHVGNAANIHGNVGRHELQTLITADTLFNAMDLSGSEVGDFGEILTHSLWGLAREGLIDADFACGDAEHLKLAGVSEDFNEAGILVMPSVLGAEMFLRGHGLALPAPSLLSPAVKLGAMGDIVVASGSRKPRETA